MEFICLNLNKNDFRIFRLFSANSEILQSLYRNSENDNFKIMFCFLNVV
jgi:hypothetical protein